MFTGTRFEPVVSNRMKHPMLPPLCAGLAVAVSAALSGGAGPRPRDASGSHAAAVASLARSGPAAVVAGQRRGLRHPHGATTVIVQVAAGGGFLTPMVTVSGVPSFGLYGKGVALIEPVVPQPFPGPARARLVVQHLTEAGVQAILVRARHAGLLVDRPIDWGLVGISDAPTTQVALHAAGGMVVRRAYALGFDDGRLSVAVRRARIGLERFITRCRGRAGTRPPYAPQSVAVWVAPAVVTAECHRNRRSRGLSPATWPPCAGPLATGCAACSSTGRLYAVCGGWSAEANAATPWVSRPSGTARFGLAFRPLLPGEHGCIGGAIGVG